METLKSILSFVGDLFVGVLIFLGILAYPWLFVLLVAFKIIFSKDLKV